MNQSRHTRAARWIPVVVMAVGLGLGGQAALASEIIRPGSLSIGGRAGIRAFDRLAEADPRQERRSEINSGVELGYGLRSGLAASITARWGQNYFDFSGANGSGNAVEESWMVRPGLDWYLPMTAISGYLGVGLEYGEARSWNNNPVMGLEGPRNLFAGVGFRAGLAARPASRWRARCELLVGGYHARVRHEATDMEYRWLGSSSGVAFGLDYLILKGRPSAEGGE